MIRKLLCWLGRHRLEEAILIKGECVDLLSEKCVHCGQWDDPEGAAEAQIYHLQSMIIHEGADGSEEPQPLPDEPLPPSRKRQRSSD